MQFTFSYYIECVHLNLKHRTGYGKFAVYITMLKYLNSTVAKRGTVFIGLMTPDGAIRFRYHRTVLMR